MKVKWACAAFSALGLLTGLLTGMTASSVVIPVLGLIFALLGGSIAAFVQKLTVTQLNLAMKCILFLSLFCMVGVLAGIVITEHQLLSPIKPTPDNEVNPTKTLEGRKYLKENLIGPAASIDAKRRDKNESYEIAYKELLALVYKMELELKERPVK